MRTSALSRITNLAKEAVSSQCRFLKAVKQGNPGGYVCTMNNSRLKPALLEPVRTQLAFSTPILLHPQDVQSRYCLPKGGVWVTVSKKKWNWSPSIYYKPTCAGLLEQSSVCQALHLKLILVLGGKQQLVATQQPSSTFALRYHVGLGLDASNRTWRSGCKREVYLIKKYSFRLYSCLLYWWMKRILWAIHAIALSCALQ